MILKCLFDLFISERNLVFITFNIDEMALNEAKVKSSVLRRLIKVLTTV